MEYRLSIFNFQPSVIYSRIAATEIRMKKTRQIAEKLNRISSRFACSRVFASSSERKKMDGQLFEHPSTSAEISFQKNNSVVELLLTRPSSRNCIIISPLMPRQKRSSEVQHDWSHKEKKYSNKNKNTNIHFLRN